MDFEVLTPKQRVEYVQGLVDRHTRGTMAAAAVCRRHYQTDNPAIMGRTKSYASAETVTDKATGLETMHAVAKENRFAANEKVASSFFRDITDQKVAYIMGEGADVTADSESDADAETVKLVSKQIARQLRRIGQRCLTDALVYSHGYAYMQVIAGRLRLNFTSYTEVIAEHDDNGELDAVCRYWKSGKTERAEYHTASKVWSYEAKPGEDWQETGERWQIEQFTVYGDGTVQPSGGRGWYRLPWFELSHNNEGTSSLTNAAKTMIRCYDIVTSDFANNLIDMQDVFVTLKADNGYGSGMEYGEIIEMLKAFKVAEGVEGVQAFEIPYQARQVLLDLMDKSIYKTLRGVDVGRIANGNLINNAIRALYSDIDLWADQCEWHLEEWTRDIVDAAAWYLGIEMPEYSITFQRRVLFDEVQQMQALAAQKGVISNKTIYENHPLVSDAQAEIERVEAEEAGAAYAIGVPVGAVE